MMRTDRKDGWKIIAEWLRKRFDPSHVGRKGELIGRDGRVHRIGKVRIAPELLPELRLAANAPISAKGDIAENQLPAFFRTWLPIAWEAVVQDLPHADEVTTRPTRTQLKAAISKIEALPPRPRT